MKQCALSHQRRVVVYLASHTSQSYRLWFCFVTFHLVLPTWVLRNRHRQLLRVWYSFCHTYTNSDSSLSSSGDLRLCVVTYRMDSDTAPQASIWILTLCCHPVLGLCLCTLAQRLDSDSAMLTIVCFLLCSAAHVLTLILRFTVLTPCWYLVRGFSYCAFTKCVDRLRAVTECWLCFCAETQWLSSDSAAIRRVDADSALYLSENSDCALQHSAWTLAVYVYYYKLSSGYPIWLFSVPVPGLCLWYCPLGTPNFFATLQQTAITGQKK